jgi:hypothetical protein
MALKIRLHAHAKDRLRERGATEEEIFATVERGERFEAKHGRIGFRCNFPFDSEWKNTRYSTKQVEAYAVEEDGWLVITAIVKFF